MKDFTHKKCCLNCDGFCFWDGDYCCFPHMEIHQSGAWRYTQFNNKPNGGFFSDTRMFSDIDKTMKTSETCKDYKYAHHERYPESDNLYIKEYKKFKEWERLCKQLDDHVKDKSGLYKKHFHNFYFKFE